jgi:hypothetical protein
VYLKNTGINAADKMIRVSINPIMEKEACPPMNIDALLRAIF